MLRSKIGHNGCSSPNHPRSSRDSEEAQCHSRGRRNDLSEPVDAHREVFECFLERDGLSEAKDGSVETRALRMSADSARVTWEENHHVPPACRQGRQVNDNNSGMEACRIGRWLGCKPLSGLYLLSPKILDRGQNFVRID